MNTKKNTQQLGIDGKSKNTNKEGSLIEFEHVKGTPFHLHGNEEEGYNVLFGKYLISKVETKKEALEECELNWFTIIKVITVIEIESKNHKRQE